MPRRALLLLLAASLAACDTNEGLDEFFNDAQQPPSGITRVTLDGCRIVEGEVDEDDWRASPAFPTVTVVPPCPNPVPVTFDGLVTLEVEAPFSDVLGGEVRLTAAKVGGGVGVLDVLPAQTFPGVGFFTFTLGDLAFDTGSGDARGLYRLFIRDGQGRLVSYGDLLVE